MSIDSKGQYLSAEQMLLFSLGVVITISIYFSFSTIHGTVENEVIEDNMKKVGNQISSGISKVYDLSGGGEKVEYVNLTVDIPKRISGEGYKIKTQESKVLVEMSSKRESVDLGNFSDVDISGEIYSGKGEAYIVFEKSAKNITITR